MAGLLDLLASSSLLLLFVVVGVGYLLGSVRVAGFSLGPAAVIFVGLFFGALDPRLKIPDLVYVLGLVIFVYAVGLQSGPTFFASFGPRALKANIFALGMIVSAAIVVTAAWGLFKLDGPAMTGMFCGALTNTPALAASIETLRRAADGGLQQVDLLRIVNAPVIGYSVAYPFGVVGVLLGFYLFGRSSARHAEVGGGEAGAPPQPLGAMTFRIVNPATVGKTVASLFEGEEKPAFVLSRLRRGELTTLVYGETVFAYGDLIVAVGDNDALERARAVFGEEARHPIHTENVEFDYRRIEVSDKGVVGRSLRDLRLQELLDATVTRVRRGDVDFVPNGETVLERGDRIRVLTWAGNLDRVARFFGDSIKESSETDLLSLSIGLVAGVLIGMIPIPLPGGGHFTLGFAGGPLIAGLVLGAIQRSGGIVWGMPFGVNVTLRQVGLVLFLAGIGTKAGEGFVPTLLGGGWQLMLVGGVTTTLVTASVLYFGTRLLKLSLPAVMGLMAGIQTQPACLAYANEHSSSNAPNVWYASVYPMSMIAKIVLAQLLAGQLLR